MQCIRGPRKRTKCVSAGKSASSITSRGITRYGACAIKKSTVSFDIIFNPALLMAQTNEHLLQQVTSGEWACRKHSRFIMQRRGMQNMVTMDAQTAFALSAPLPLSPCFASLLLWIMDPNQPAQLPVFLRFYVCIIDNVMIPHNESDPINSAWGNRAKKKSYKGHMCIEECFPSNLLGTNKQL